jgi:hypothetical protein
MHASMEIPPTPPPPKKRKTQTVLGTKQIAVMEYSIKCENITDSSYNTANTSSSDINSYTMLHATR